MIMMPNKLQDAKKKIRLSLLNQKSKNEEQIEQRKILMKETQQKIRLSLVNFQDEEQGNILLKQSIGKGKKIITEESYMNEIECRYDEETKIESAERRVTDTNESNERDASLTYDSILLERFIRSLLEKNENLKSKLSKCRISQKHLKDENAKLKEKFSSSWRNNERTLQLEKEVEELTKTKEKLQTKLEDFKRKTEMTLHETNTALKTKEENNALLVRSLSKIKEQKKLEAKKYLEFDIIL